MRLSLISFPDISKMCWVGKGPSQAKSGAFLPDIYNTSRVEGQEPTLAKQLASVSLVGFLDIPSQLWAG
jgi:hypothetical protein